MELGVDANLHNLGIYTSPLDAARGHAQVSPKKLQHSLMQPTVLPTQTPHYLLYNTLPEGTVASVTLHGDLIMLYGIFHFP